MLTKVILEGAMGKEFGREWNLSVSSPAEALRLIDANKPGLFIWIREHLANFDRYSIVVEYEDGREEDLDEDSLKFERQMKSVRFIPIITGASGAFKAILGVVLIIVGVVINIYYPGSGTALIGMGISLFAGGIAEMLAKTPKLSDPQNNEYVGKASYYFDGPTNTTPQGAPVQLIYGRVLVGSHTISVAATIDQLM